MIYASYSNLTNLTYEHTFDHSAIYLNESFIECLSTICNLSYVAPICWIFLELEIHCFEPLSLLPGNPNVSSFSKISDLLAQWHFRQTAIEIHCPDCL